MVNRETSLERRRRYLMDRPQKLGVLPTMSFWNDKANWKHVRVPMAVLAASVTIGIGVLSLGPLLSGLLGGATLVAAIGGTERYIRAKAVGRLRQ